MAIRATFSFVEQHDETGSGAGGHEELYLVLSGHATFMVDGDEIDAPAGTLIFVPDVSSRRPQARSWAATDNDLDPIRSDPRFPN